MLTPSKIKNHHFELLGKNAYRAHSVDEFFDAVSESYEQMFKENGELVKKISLLAERLEEYRNDEDNIRAALLTAQRMADRIMKETNQKADKKLNEVSEYVKKQEAESDDKAAKIIADAEAKAAEIIGKANQQAAKIVEDATSESKEQAVVARDRMIKAQAGLELVEKQADSFKRELLKLYSDHIELINKIPELENADEAVEVVEAVEQDSDEPAAVYEEETDTAEAEEEAQEEAEDVSVDELLSRYSEVENIDEEAEDTYDPAEEDQEYYEEDYSYDEEADSEADYEEEFAEDEEDDGFSFDIDSFNFSEDDADNDEYYDDDEDDDDNGGEGFSSKLKGFFKR